MAIPKPEPRDWLLANAQELAVTDRQVLAMLRDAKKRVDAILREMPQGNNLVRRAQLENTRARLLAEQADVFERLGDITAARRASAASRAARLSAASDAALLSLVGKSAQAQYLYDSALRVSQRAIDVSLQRMKFSALPLSDRIYRTNVWMDGRLGKLINETLAVGLNAKEFAKKARDWFNPNTPGGVRYAAMRLARTEINNAFHSMSAQKYAETPWVEEAEWNLSKSHPKPDECDAYAKASPYPSDKVPARPHPQCMCYITPKSIDEDEFIDRFVAGEYDDYIDRKLAENGWIEPEPEPRPTATPEPVRPVALSGDAAHASVPKGLFKRGTMTPKQRKALQTYESGWFMVIQGFLRGKRWGDPDYAKEERDVNEIKSAMAESILPEPIVAYRGLFKSRLVFGDRLDHDLTGFTWEDDGFGSVTTEEKITRLFITGSTDPEAEPVEDSVQLKVRVAAGVGALETSTSTKGSKANGPQAEITLQDGLKWRVVKDNGYDAEGVRQLEVEVDRVSASDVSAGTDAGEAGRSAGERAGGTEQSQGSRTETSKLKRRNDPEYKKHYERGWRAGAKSNDLSRADSRGEPDAYYHGFSDRSIGEPKWTRADELDEMDLQPQAPISSIRRALDSGIRESRTLSGGVAADTKLVTTNDGTQLVQKTMGGEPVPGITQLNDPKRQADAEELSSILLRAMGVEAPEVEREAYDRVALEYLDGATPAVDMRLNFANQDRVAADLGMGVGLFDIISANADRNPGNWMLNLGSSKSDSHLHPIDHGFAWLFEEGDELNPSPYYSRFGELAYRQSPWWRMTHKDDNSGAFRDNDYSQADIAAMRQILDRVRPEFERVGRLDWWQVSLQRLEAFAPYAKGTELHINAAN